MEEKNKAWKTVSSKYLFRRPWLTVRCEDMLLPNGNHIPEYYILEYPDWVTHDCHNQRRQICICPPIPSRHRPDLLWTLCRCVWKGRRFAIGIRPTRIMGRNRLRKWQLAGIYGDFRQSEHSHQSDVLLPCNRCGTHRPPTSGSYRRSFRASAHLGRGETAAG